MSTQYAFRSFFTIIVLFRSYFYCQLADRKYVNSCTNHIVTNAIGGIIYNELPRTLCMII